VNVLAVSTFNEAGFNLYGRRMIESFREYWHPDVDLVDYSEGWGAVGSVDLLGESPWLAEFKARNRSRPFKDYRWDAVRFSHKVAALCHAAQNTDPDLLIWIDGDVVTHAPVTMDDIAEMAPAGDEWIAWLDRKGMHPECGLFILNCRQPRHAEAIRTFERMYSDDLLFRLPEFHDSYVLQRVVQQMEMPAKSLSGDARGTSHPAVNGPLGRWFDHQKGDRKRLGKTPQRDLVRPRAEAYWQ
jgi:hypothetical protein